MTEGRLATLAVIAEVVRLGETQFRRVGHTLLQKLVYLLQEAVGIRLGYDFRMHLHGPYSADLWGDLTQLRDDHVLEIEADPSGYGYHVTEGPAASALVENQAARVTTVRPELERLLSLLGQEPVRRLEALSTVHFVASALRRHGQESDPETVIQKVRALKPHLSENEIDNAYRKLAQSGLALL